MLTYCLKCKKDIESVTSKVLKTKKWKAILPSKCAACKRTRSKGIIK